MIVIGLTGKKNSGKDTAGNLIAEEFRKIGYQCHRLAFADEVKLLLASLTGGDIDIINKQKADLRLRKLLQYLGTEIGREEDKNIWINKLGEKLDNLCKQPAGAKPVLVYVTDIRFINEAEYVKSRGGLILKIERPSNEEDSHKSETELDKIHPHFHIKNDSGLNRLAWEVKIVCSFIRDRLKL